MIVVNWLKESVSLWLEVSPYLFLGIIIAGLLHIFLGKEFISNHLGKGGISSVVKATIFGIPLPVCSCGVIPLASSLRKDGAHKSSVLSFLVSTPTTGVDSFLATYSLLGPLFAIFRPLGALIAGLVLGIVDYFVEGKKENLEKIPKHTHINTSHVFKFKEFLRFSFIDMPKDIGKWLIVGTLLGGAISSIIPKEVFSQHLNFPLDFLIALVVGIPLYVCSTGSIPIAVALISKGFSPGAGLVFLIAGPATNAITLSFVRAKLGKKSFYLYLGSIIFVSIILGLIFNYFWFLLGQDQTLITGAGKMLAIEYKVFFGAALFILIMSSMPRKEKCYLDANLEIYVPDIHCGHCELALTSSLKGLVGVEGISIDVEKKVVLIKGSIDKNKVIEKIKEAGYHPDS